MRQWIVGFCALVMSACVSWPQSTQPTYWTLKISQDPINDERIVALGVIAPDLSGGLMVRCEGDEAFLMVFFSRAAFEAGQPFEITYRVDTDPAEKLYALAMGQFQGHRGFLTTEPQPFAKADEILSFLKAIYKNARAPTPDGKSPVRIRIRAESVGAAPPDLALLTIASRQQIRSFAQECGLSFNPD